MWIDFHSINRLYFARGIKKAWFNKKLRGLATRPRGQQVSQPLKGIKRKAIKDYDLAPFSDKVENHWRRASARRMAMLFN